MRAIQFVGGGRQISAWQTRPRDLDSTISRQGIERLPPKIGVAHDAVMGPCRPSTAITPPVIVTTKAPLHANLRSGPLSLPLALNFLWFLLVDLCQFVSGRAIGAQQFVQF